MQALPGPSPCLGHRLAQCTLPHMCDACLFPLGRTLHAPPFVAAPCMPLPSWPHPACPSPHGRTLHAPPFMAAPCMPLPSWPHPACPSLHGRTLHAPPLMAAPRTCSRTVNYTRSGMCCYALQACAVAPCCRPVRSSITGSPPAAAAAGQPGCDQRVVVADHHAAL